MFKKTALFLKDGFPYLTVLSQLVWEKHRLDIPHFFDFCGLLHFVGHGKGFLRLLVLFNSIIDLSDTIVPQLLSSHKQSENCFGAQVDVELEVLVGRRNSRNCVQFEVVTYFEAIFSVLQVRCDEKPLKYQCSTL